jgi:endonuclease/exonuclease/phosphatase family metal-dependent hydrolase
VGRIAHTQENQAERWRRLHAAIPFLAPGIFGAWLIGELLADRYDYLVLFYHIPAVVYGAALLAVAALAWFCRHRWSAVLAAVLALGPALCVLLVENQWTRPTPPPHDGPTYRLVGWNIQRYRHGLREIADRIKALEPDLVVLSEIHSRFALRRIARRLGPDYDATHGRKVGVIARGKLRTPRWIWKGSGQRYVVRWESPAGPVSLLTADLPNRKFESRRPLLEKLRENISEYRPDLVVGDFNAPRRSPALRDLPEGYAHAYHLAGAGWSYTWRTWCPFLAIDHCIVNRQRIAALRYDILSTTLSDHRIQVLDFAVASE